MLIKVRTTVLEVAVVFVLAIFIEFLNLLANIIKTLVYSNFVFSLFFFFLAVKLIVDIHKRADENTVTFPHVNHVLSVLSQVQQ